MSRTGQVLNAHSLASSRAINARLDSRFEEPVEDKRLNASNPSGSPKLDSFKSSLSRKHLNASLFNNHFKGHSKPDPKVVSQRNPESLHLPPINQKSHFRINSKEVSERNTNKKFISESFQKNMPDSNKATKNYKQKSARRAKSLRKRGVKDFRLYIFAVLFLIKFKKSLVSRYIEKKSVYPIQKHLGAFEQNVKIWVSSVVPMNIILQDKSFKFDIIDKKPSEKNTKKLEKLQAIVFTIIKGLIEVAKPQNKEINWFLLRYCSEGTVFPADWLTPFEKTRLKFGHAQGLAKVNDEVRMMLLAFFIITRCIVKDNLLQEREKFKVKSRQFVNLTVLSSMLQYLVVTSFARVGRNINEWSKDKTDIENRKLNEMFEPVIFIQCNDDTVSHNLYPSSCFQRFSSIHDRFCNDMRKNLHYWSQYLLRTIKKKV